MSDHVCSQSAYDAGRRDCTGCTAINAARVATWRQARIAAGHARHLVYGNKTGTGWDRWARNQIGGGRAAA